MGFELAKEAIKQTVIAPGADRGQIAGVVAGTSDLEASLRRMSTFVRHVGGE